MVLNDTNIYQKMKNKSLLSIEKNIRWEKTAYYNYKKLFLFNNHTCISKTSDLENYFDEKYIKAEYQDIFWESNFKKPILKL